MVIAVLAVQGSFFEHEQILEKLGVEYFEIRRKADLDKYFDGLILPGGESTTMGKLLKELDIFDTLQKKIADGLPVYGTCAGMILLANNLSNDKNVYFGTMDITVKRNAYGRQLGSFETVSDVKGIGEVPMVFIRAPYIESVGEGVDVLATVNGNIVAARQGNQLATSFHPELTDDTSVHQYFLDMIK
ncbi:pyridoxal 5'-phosphate synthase glutaminase subunit PdxT [Candidatus Pseudoruminococcus sp.]|uniref:pyridoxal 5'-phosphate synthase glutaminase subunit PdxT n=1 Tax=Candidatus Pseudoruminococcus sp. TaxID=3101048 RepID=UPI0039997747